MKPTLVTGPQFNAVALDELAHFLRVEEDDDNPLLRSFLDFATDKAESITGRRLAQQTWRLDLEKFESEIILPYPPLISVDSIIYYDSNNVQTTLDTSYYEVTGISHIGKIKPNYGYTYPSTYPKTDAVQITFTCGYTGAELIPEGIKNGIKSVVWQMYDTRGEKIDDNFFNFLFGPYTLRGFEQE